MADIISRGSADHYKWGSDCDGWHLVRRDDLSVIEERIPAGKGEAKHRHGKSRQFFFVLEGEAVVEVDGETSVLREREGIEVVPKATHQIRNESSRDVRLLVISAPKSHGDREADD